MAMLSDSVVVNTSEKYRSGAEVGVGSALSSVVVSDACVSDAVVDIEDVISVLSVDCSEHAQVNSAILNRVTMKQDIFFMMEVLPEKCVGVNDKTYSVKYVDAKIIDVLIRLYTLYCIRRI